MCKKIGISEMFLSGFLKRYSWCKKMCFEMSWIFFNYFYRSDARRGKFVKWFAVPLSSFKYFCFMLYFHSFTPAAMFNLVMRSILFRVRFLLKNFFNWKIYLTEWLRYLTVLGLIPNVDCKEIFEKFWWVFFNFVSDWIFESEWMYEIAVIF